jgi:hypothetical protein
MQEKPTPGEQIKMKKRAIILILSFCLVLTGCRNDEEILKFFDEWDVLAAEMVRKIESRDVDGARAAFEAKKESLGSVWRKIPRKTSGSNTKIYLSSAVLKRYQESYFNNLSSVSTAAIPLEIKLANDRAKLEKLRNLVTEYRATFR